MKNKYLNVMAIIFVILLCIVLYPSVKERFIPQHPSSEISFSIFTKDTTKYIEIQDKNSTLILNKEADTWKVASYAASIDKVEKLFSDFSQAKIGTIVSTNLNNTRDYGLASDSATRLTVDRNGQKNTILIGKSDSTGSSFYAKKNNSKNVYIVEGNLENTLTTKLSDWRDRVVIRLNPDQIRVVDVVGPTSFQLTKASDGTWERTVNGHKTDKPTSDVPNLMTRLSTLTASDFYIEEESNNKKFSADKRIVTIKDKDGNVLTELTIIPDEAYYLVIVKGKLDPYKVAGYNLDEFFKLVEK